MQYLFMILVGATVPGRFTEQHDIFFGVGDSLDAIKPAVKKYWEGAKGIHIDAWRMIQHVEGFNISISTNENKMGEKRLFFLNLGGYKPNVFEEFHYKLIVAASDKGDAVKQGRKHAFYRHTGFKGAPSHIDEKFGIDVDDFFEIADVLPSQHPYHIHLTAGYAPDDEVHPGYIKL